MIAKAIKIRVLVTTSQSRCMLRNAISYSRNAIFITSHRRRSFSTLSNGSFALASSLPHRTSLNASASPISDWEFADRMASIGVKSDVPIAVAVSGGADSTALCLLLHRWLLSACSLSSSCCGPSRLTAVSIDHRLRSESTDEIGFIGRWCTQRGIEHVWHQLQWDATPSVAAVQTDARSRRYQALLDICVSRGIPLLCVGHHRGDQIETFLSRLTRCSGLHGLAGMEQKVRIDESVTMVRPLLTWDKSRLEATCRSMDQDWIIDPSNVNAAYDRIRIRSAVERITTASPTPAISLNDFDQLLGVLQRSRESLDNVTSSLLRRSATIDTVFGSVSFDVSILRGVSEPLAVHVLSRAFCVVRGEHYMPDNGAVVRLWREVRRIDQSWNNETSTKLPSPYRSYPIFGCLVTPCPSLSGIERIVITRHSSNPIHLEHRLPLTSSSIVRWDGRFDISLESGSSNDPKLFVRTFTAHDRRVLKELLAALYESVGGHRSLSLHSSLPHLQARDGSNVPVVVDEHNTIVAVPHICNVNDGEDFIGLRRLLRQSNFNVSIRFNPRGARVWRWDVET